MINKFLIITYFLTGFLFTCFSFGISLYFGTANSDLLVRFLLASYLLAFVVTFAVAYLRK